MGSDQNGNLGPREAMEILRQEGKPGITKPFFPFRSNMGSVCLHATGPITPNGTTGSMVAELNPDVSQNRFWFTGTSIPSISFFIPAGFSGTSFLEKNFEQPGAAFDSSLWWTHEKFYREIQRFYPEAKRAVQQRILDLENLWFEESNRILKKRKGQKTLDTLSETTIRTTLQEYRFWNNSLLNELKSKNRQRTFAPFYNWQWSVWNRKAGINVS